MTPFEIVVVIWLGLGVVNAALAWRINRRLFDKGLMPLEATVIVLAGVIGVAFTYVDWFCGAYRRREE